AYAHVSSHKAMTGKTTDDEQKRWLRAAEIIHDAPVWISDRDDWTTTTLKADVARLIEEHGIEWVLIDYAGLLNDQAESELAREKIISQQLASIAKMDIAVIAVETLNKQGFGGNKTLAGVRGSVQKVYDADVVAFLERQDEESMVRHLRFTKARDADMYLKIPMVLNGPEKRFDPAIETRVQF
ncbi:MAG: hypothetical protein DRJ03_01390, partial [Chloroflexi bacterium]